MKHPYVIIAILLSAANGSGQDTAINPKQFGAIGDGISHKITPADITTRNADARGNRRWVGTYAVGDEWDYVGLQEAIYAAFQNGTLKPNKENRKLNKPLHIPAGFYVVNKSPTMTEVQGGIVYGDGRLTTKINARTGVPAWICNGLWFTQFTGIQWSGTAAHTDGSALYEVDGNWDKTHTQTVQGNTWKDCHWDGNFVCDPDFAMCRHGTNSQGSENLFLNCHFNNPKHTAFYNYTYNALQQTFIGGNFSQHCLGIGLSAGSVNVFSVGFQAAKPKQIDQGGEDLHISNSADTHSSIMNCRSESFKFLATYNQHYVTAINNNLDSAAPNGQWLPNHAYAAGQITSGITGGRGNGHLHRVLVAGTSGATEPAWNDQTGISGLQADEFTGSTTAGGTMLTATGRTLFPADRVGQGIIIVGAGASGANLYTTCVSRADTTHMVLGAAAGTSVTNGRVLVGPITTDGTCQWIQEEFDEVVMSTGILEGNSFRWGRVRYAGGGQGAYLELNKNTWCRPDPFPRNSAWIDQTAIDGLLFPLFVTNTGRVTTKSVVSLNGGLNSGVQAYADLGRPPSEKSIAANGTITVSMDRSVQTITPKGDCTFNALGGTPGDCCTFVITTSGTTSYTMTFGTNFKSTGVLATGTASGKLFSVSFICKTPKLWVETSRTTAM